MSNIGAKLNEIYDDLSSNITRIYERNNLHLAIDLTYHSVMEFKFDGKDIKKGYVESLIIGDTRCGKSETAETLVKHYQIGEIAPGENCTFAGLVGGLQQFNGRWTITWGKIPLNNRRLLVIDEVSGIPVEDIANLSQIRSSGVAEITKIQTERTDAHTRLIWMSNPRTNKTVNHFSSGVDLVRDVVGKPEDIARFDFAIIVAKSDVDYNRIQEYSNRKVQHIFTNDHCRDLVLWAWSREKDHINLTKESVDACYYFAKKMCEKYSADCPLVNASEQKIKIARLAVALAARLFSTRDGVVLDVYPEHVEFIYDFLNTEYDRTFFGYDTWSASKSSEAIMDEPKIFELLCKIGPQSAKQILNMNQVHLNDLEELIGCGREDAKTFLSTMLKNGALVKIYKGYFKTPQFITMLKGFINPHKEAFYVKNVGEKRLDPAGAGVAKDAERDHHTRGGAKEN